MVNKTIADQIVEVHNTGSEAQFLGTDGVWYDFNAEGLKAYINSTSTAPVTSVAGKTGDVVLAAADITDLDEATVAQAQTANALNTARTIALSGGATATGSFDGSANLTLATTLATPTATVRGGVLQNAAVADLAGDAALEDITLKVNAILAAARTSGWIASA